MLTVLMHIKASGRVYVIKALAIGKKVAIKDLSNRERSCEHERVSASEYVNSLCSYLVENKL